MALPNSPGSVRFVPGHARSIALPNLFLQLDRLQLPQWRVVLREWISRFDGLEEYLPGADDCPENEILWFLQAAPIGIADIELADRLASADFLTWRVRHPETRELWSFVDQPFKFFCVGVLPAVYQLDTEHPAQDVTSAWLLEQLHDRP